MELLRRRLSQISRGTKDSDTSYFVMKETSPLSLDDCDPSPLSDEEAIPSVGDGSRELHGGSTDRGHAGPP